MRSRREKFLSALLSAAMILTLIPAASIPANAAVELAKPDIDVSDTGRYVEAGIGKGASRALFVNGAFGANPTIGSYSGKLVSEDNSKSDDVSAYNMMNCFGMYRNGTTVSEQTEGFTHSGGQSINWGSGQYVDSLNVATYNNNGGSSGSLTVRIANNETLKTLARSGGLQVYFNGYTSAGKEARKAWPDDHTYVYGTVDITNGTANNGARTKSSTGKTEDCAKRFGTDGWVTLSENSVISISWSVSKSSGKFSNGWADKDVGIGNCVMLFRKIDCPNIADYTLTANGDFSNAGDRGAEVLLGNDGRIQLDLNVTLETNKDKSDLVYSSLGGIKIPQSDDYNLLVQLGKRVLFRNTEGTGYSRQGEPVYMKLTDAGVLEGGSITTRSLADTDAARLAALQGGISSLHYEWNAAEGDYYGNNAIPGGGDWAGLVSSSNSLNLIDSIVLASFHDLAGNPLKLGGQLVPYQKSGSGYSTNLQYEKATQYRQGATYYKDGDVYRLVQSDPGTLGSNHYTKRNVLTGTVKLNNLTRSGVGNPFAADNSTSSGFGFVINAVTPTYSRSTNAVQPDILTRMTLNNGDSFDIALNFSEIVKLREFKSNGSGGTTDTGFAPENLYLELNNGLRARYKSGMGTRQLIFTVSVPDQYTLVTVCPLTWESDYASYYTKDGETYTQVSGGSAPQWSANTYYSKVDDVTGGSFLEIRRMFVEDAATHATVELTNPHTATYRTYNGGSGAETYSVADDYVLTDYVGNPVCEYIGRKESGYDTTMAWAKLQVDNTKPQIDITETQDHQFSVSVTENGSGVFHIDNATQGGDSAGVAYYVWVKGADDAKAVSEQFIANNYEKVKRFSLAPGEKDKVTVNGTTYQLKSCVPGGDPIPPKTEEGDWYLLVFTADMTWDSARQLIQYGKSSYRDDPAGYISTLANQLGVSFGDLYEAVTAKPADWEDAYYNYFYQNSDGTFSNISKGDEYPAWEAGKYYTRAYTALDTEPDDWDPYREDANGTLKKLNDGRYVPAEDSYTGTKYSFDDSSDYTAYYEKSGTAYVPIKPVSGKPPFLENTYYGYDIVTTTVTDANADSVYLRDVDSDGGSRYVSAKEKFAPAFVEGGVYDSNETPVSEKPSDWEDNYSAYQYGATAYEPFGTWKSEAVIESGKYFTRSGEDPNYTYTPITDTAWDSAYESGTYYVTEDSSTYTEATVAPVFEAGSYYTASYVSIDGDTSDNGETFTEYDENGAATGSTVEWDGLYSGCYTLSGSTYTPVGNPETAPTYAAGTYYRLVYTPVSDETEWSANYQNCLKGGLRFTAVTAEFPADETYYGATAQSLATEPADWATAYRYYSTTSVSPDSYSPVQWQSAPAFEADKYYSFDMVAYAPASEEMADGLPIGWVQNYNQFYYNAGTQTAPDYRSLSIDSSAQREALSGLGISITSVAPAFTGFTNGVYRAKTGAEGFFVDELAKKVDETRREAFTADMLKAYSNAQKIDVIRRYSAFVDDVYATDTAYMARSANYADWNGNDYSKNDSNWACAISGSVDVIAPEVTFGALTGDNTENVTVPVSVSDNNAVGTVKYQFVTAEEAENITKETADNWETVADENKTSFSVTTASANLIQSGSYVLCVLAEDNSENKTLVKQAVTVNSSVDIRYDWTDPAGTKPYKEITGASAVFYGTAYGSDIFGRGFKVYAAIDDNASKSKDDTDWAELTGADADSVTVDDVTYAAKSYAMPEKKGVTGYYYLHVMYTCDAMTEPGKFDKAYWLEDNEADIAINQDGSDENGITVSIAASGASSIEYAVTAVGENAPASWTAYTEALTILRSDYPSESAVRVWARINGDDATIRSADFLLSGASQPTGVLADPKLTLVDVLTEKNKRYAIVRFDDLGDALSVGAEYSVAVAAPNTAASKLVWQRWMPLDNMVKVRLENGNMRLTFKFRNGDSETQGTYPTLDVASNAVGTGEAWIVATRSTLRVVNGNDGVKLTMQSKGVTGTTKETVHANGVFEHGVFRAVVSNISNNPAAYTLVWSDGGDHVGATGASANSVLVTLKSEENITVTALTFEGEAIEPARSYHFKSNGTAQFTFRNEAGSETTAVAKVTWLDTEAWELNVTEDQSNFTSNGSVANGARLVVTSNKQLANMEINGQNAVEDMGLDISSNGIYVVTATNTRGDLTARKIVVSDIADKLTAPVQVSESAVENGSVTVTVKGTASALNPVFDGPNSDGTPITVDGSGTYTLTKTYTRNGRFIEYVTDSLGNTVSYQLSVSQFDTEAPVIRTKGGMAISKTATPANESAAQVNAWLKNALYITDDHTSESDIVVTVSGTVNTAKVGAYSILVNAEDAAGNRSMKRVTVYILPTDGMLVTDEHGVLFCSQSKDAALVDRNGEKQVVLSVSNYDIVRLENVTVAQNRTTGVTNAKAEVTVTVKQGAFREGQMKYFDQVATGKISYSDGTATITLNVDDLPGTGWYTVLVRNAEREREFTTFFINADN